MAADEYSGQKAASIDWEDLKRHSLQPGGFGPSRVQIWPEILGVRQRIEMQASIDDAYREHRDERQIRLDTDRSFVLYPVDTSLSDKELMQEKLNNLLVSVFRQHPKLNYFQGYHDIVSVLYLTLPEELQLACVQKISLHRVRDSMGSTLEPVLGLLRVTKHLLRLADSQYARRLESLSQLPFYALSNLLTLFSHDIPTLSLIQHVFDYILCRPPIIIVYLVTVIILSRKEVFQQLEDEDQEECLGMAHSILSTLPLMTDGEKLGDVKVRGGRKEAVHDSERQEVKVEKAESMSLTEAKENMADPCTTPEITADLVATELIPLWKEESLDEKSPLSSPVTSRPSTPLSRLPPIKLTSLLSQADELYALYPPTHPELFLASIMGPQSVVYTWSESFSALPTDAEAEAMVLRPELIVYPYVEDDAEGETEGNKKCEKKPASGKLKCKHFRGKLHGKLKGKLKRLRRGRVDQTTGMVAGAVIVLGIAFAVYGVKIRDKYSEVGLSFLENQGRDWKRVVGWAGGAVVGVTERVVSSLSGSASNGR
ncbi:TBC1 domain family member 20 [Termitomyces sp. T112]|nr:TBC1 domain family member 20 [Termitomyces sp. T112]